MLLNELAREVYARQIMIDEIGEEGQEKLCGASVLVVGCGGLGSPVLYYLTAMGIGHIGLCDGDVVSPSNLNRQVLYTMEDIGRSKASAAARRLQALNPRLRVTVYDCFLTAELAGNIIPSYDIVVDCLDNFAARFIINDACIAADRPFVHAGVSGFHGQLLTVTPGGSPCLRCLFPRGDNKPTVGQQGVLGSTPAVLGALEATEAVKYLLGLPLNNDGFLLYDGLRMNFEKVSLLPAANCACQKRRQKNY